MRATALAIAGIALVGCNDTPAPTPSSEQIEPASTESPSVGATQPTTNLRTSRPSAATISVLSNVAGVEVVTFFEPGAVRDQVFGYFSELSKRNGDSLRIRELDVAHDAAQAKAFGISRNGVIVLKAADASKTIVLGASESEAERRLRKLDSDVRNRLLVLRDPQVAVVFRSAKAQPRGALFDTTLRALGFEVVSRDPAAERELPAGAKLVVFVDDGTRPVGAGLSIARSHFEGGGAAFIALEPAPGRVVDRELRALGLVLDPIPLASETGFLNLSREEDDHGNIITKEFASHPATRSLLDRKGVMVAFPSAGSLAAIDESALHPQPIVHSRPDAFRDKNGDKNFDERTENRGRVPIAFAVEHDSGGRACVFADATWLDQKLLSKVAAGPLLLGSTVTWTLALGIDLLDPVEANLTTYPLRAADASAPQGPWWEDPGDVVSVQLDTRAFELRIERTPSGQLWAQTTRAPATAATKVAEFPVAPARAATLLERLAAPSARQVLGKLGAKKRDAFELDSTDLLTVGFTNGARTLRLGKAIKGRGEQYALDPSSGVAYVLDGQVFRDLENADRLFPVRRIVSRSKTTEIVVEAGSDRWTLTRAADAKRWEAVGSKVDKEATEALVGNILALRPEEFDRAATAEGMLLVARIQARGGSGEAQTVEIYRRSGRPRDSFYAKIPQTPGLARLYHGAPGEVADTLALIAGTGEL